MESEKITKKKLVEETFFPAKGLDLSRLDEGFLPHAKIHGWVSKNNRTYVKEGVHPEMYRDKACNIDHLNVPGQTTVVSSTPYSARFGWFEDPVKEHDGVYGMFRFNPKHAMAESFIWWVRNKPDKIGFSHDAYGDVVETNNGEIVKDVTEVYSVALVADSATNKSILESVMNQTTVITDPATVAVVTPPVVPVTPPVVIPPPPVVLTEAEKAAQKRKEAFAKNVKIMEGMMDDTCDTTMGNVMSEEEEMHDISEEMASAANKIFLHPTMDPKHKLSKIRQLLKVHHTPMEEAVKTVRKIMSDQPKNLEEARKLLMEAKIPAAGIVLSALDEHEMRVKVSERKTLSESLCETLKLSKDAKSEYFLKKLTECKDEAEMKAMIEDRKQLYEAINAPPRSANPVIPIDPSTPPEQQRGPDGKPLTEAEVKAKYDEQYLRFEAAVIGSVN